MSAAEERLWLADQITRMRVLLDGLDSRIRLEGPCSETTQVIADAGVRLVATAARHDAYQQAEAKLSAADWSDVCDALMDAASVHHSGPRADRIEALRDRIREELTHVKEPSTRS